MQYSLHSISKRCFVTCNSTLLLILKILLLNHNNWIGHILLKVMFQNNVKEVPPLCQWPWSGCHTHYSTKFHICLVISCIYNLAVNNVFIRIVWKDKLVVTIWIIYSVLLKLWICDLWLRLKVVPQDEFLWALTPLYLMVPTRTTPTSL